MARPPDRSSYVSPGQGVFRAKEFPTPIEDPEFAESAFNSLCIEIGDNESNLLTASQQRERKSHQSMWKY